MNQPRRVWPIRVCLGLFLAWSSASSCTCMEAPVAPPVGPGILSAGCPEDDRSRALRIDSPQQRMQGDWVLGAPGDFLLMNTRVAIVVQGTERPRTFFHYGGNLIDAVALDGCDQAGPEQFGELSFVLGTLDADDFTQSTLKAFRGREITIVNDGSDGRAAVVRVHGDEAMFWLVETELIRRAVADGPGKRITENLGLSVALDYVLEPDSAVVRMDFVLENPTQDTHRVMIGQVVFPADMTATMAFANGSLSLGGQTLPLQMPWVSWASGEASYALGRDYADMGMLEVAGVNAIFDVTEMLDPIVLEPGDSQIRSLLLSTAAGHHNDAVIPLHGVLEQPMPNHTWQLETLSGQVLDAHSDQALPDIEIRLQMRDVRGRYQDLSAFLSGAQGRFSVQIPVLDPGGDDLRLVGYRPGSDASEPLALTAPYDQPIELRMPAQGALRVRVNDGDGQSMPAKVLFVREDGVRFQRWIPPWESDQWLPPGQYTWHATRGFEYRPAQGDLTILPGETAELVAALPHVVDTSGWLASDSHVHSSPSEDSTVMVETRLLTLAAEGIEAFIGSDHEIITDLSPFLEPAGLSGWIATVVGAELTASSPEHHTIAGLSVRAEEPRGGIVAWGGLDMAQLHDAARQRGAQLIGLNHPRLGCSWLCLIDWDRLTGEARVADPTLLGMPVDAELFSWNFDFIEYMNGPKDPFVDPENPRETGLFEDWQAMLNLGYRITAVGASDVHGLTGGGDARSYVQSDVTPSDFIESDYLNPMLEGRVLVSTGAFATVAIDGAGMGDTVTVEGGEVTLDLVVRALEGIDVDWILVTYNCDEVARFRADDSEALEKYAGSVEFTVNNDGHVAVMGFGDGAMPTGLQNYNPTRTPRFTTNAIYVDADGDGQWTPPGGKTCRYSLEPPAP